MINFEVFKLARQQLKDFDIMYKNCHFKQQGLAIDKLFDLK